MSFNVIGVGEVLWDLLPSGPQLGGAPCNFACHARALGARAAVITRVGDDHLGKVVQERFEQIGIAGVPVQIDGRAPTGTVAVTLSGNGIPNFVINEPVAWDRIIETQAALAAAEVADAVCFGTLAQRHEPSRQTIRRIVAATPRTALRVLDINLRQNFFSLEIIERSLRLANVLKLNESELSVLSSLFALTGSIRQRMESLALQFDLRVIALTRGPAGSLLFCEGQWSDCHSMPITVVDTVGAGDAFGAALAMGLLYKFDLDEINELADETARYVCSSNGATPPLPESICDRFVAKQLQIKISPALANPLRIGG